MLAAAAEKLAESLEDDDDEADRALEAAHRRIAEKEREAAALRDRLAASRAELAASRDKMAQLRLSLETAQRQNVELKDSADGALRDAVEAAAKAAAARAYAEAHGRAQAALTKQSVPPPAQQRPSVPQAQPQPARPKPEPRPRSAISAISSSSGDNASDIVEVDGENASDIVEVDGDDVLDLSDSDGASFGGASGGSVMSDGESILDEDETQADDDWNARFQAAMEARDVEAMYRIAVDFEDIVVRYTKIIVPELRLPPSARTIPTWNAGGIAGGDKYKIRGIVFKLVTDPGIPADNPQLYLYGGERPNYEYASKSAGHEIRSAMQYYRLAYDELHLEETPSDDVLRVPMQLMVDYRGFRLLAMPLLPIQGSESLIYGCDAHARVMRCGESQPRARTALASAAKVLYLAEHESLGKRIHSAGDIELHMGSDGRMYLIDLARAFPPEDPKVVRHLPVSGQPLLFRLLRPELLQRMKGDHACAPLNPDAFTRWSSGDKDKKKHDAEVSKATRYLMKTVIPLFARKLKTGEIRVQVPISSEFHAQGINIRHIGCVLREVETGLNADSDAARQAATVLVVEMVARTLKNRIRAALREKSEVPDSEASTGEVSADAARRAAAMSRLASFTRALDIINAFISTPPDDEFWQSLHAGVRMRFGRVGAGPGYRALVNRMANPELILQCILYTIDMVGFALHPSAQRDLERSLRQNMNFRFYREDFSPETVRVKQIGVFQMAVAARLLELGSTEMKTNIPVAKRLLTMAYGTFREMSKSMSPLMQTVEAAVKSVTASELTFDAEIQRGEIKARAASQMLECEYLGDYKGYVRADAVLNNGLREAKERKFFAMAKDLARFGMRVWALLRKKNLQRLDDSVARNRMARLGGLSTSNALQDFLRIIGAQSGSLDEHVTGESAKEHHLLTQEEIDAFMATTWYSGNVVRNVAVLDQSIVRRPSNLSVASTLSRTAMVALQKKLTRAVQDHDMDTVLDLLLNEGVEVSSARGEDNQNGYTPLMFAVLADKNDKKDHAVLKLLLAARSDINVQNDKGVTALMVACQYAEPETISLLLQMGARTDIKDGKGKLALHYAGLGTRKPQRVLEELKPGRTTAAAKRRSQLRRDLYSLVDFDPERAGGLLVGPPGYRRRATFDTLCARSQMGAKLEPVHQFTVQNVASRNDLLYLCKEIGGTETTASVQATATWSLLAAACNRIIGANKINTEGALSVRLRMIEVGNIDAADLLSTLDETWCVGYRQGVSYYRSPYPAKGSKPLGTLKYKAKVQVDQRRGEWLRHDKGWSHCAQLYILTPRIDSRMFSKSELSRVPPPRLPDARTSGRAMKFYAAEEKAKARKSEVISTAGEVKAQLRKGFLARNPKVNNPVITQLEIVMSKEKKGAPAKLRRSNTGLAQRGPAVETVEVSRIATLTAISTFHDYEFKSLERNVCEVLNSMLNDDAVPVTVAIEYGCAPPGEEGAEDGGTVRFAPFLRIGGQESENADTDADGEGEQEEKKVDKKEAVPFTSPEWLIADAKVKRLWMSKGKKQAKALRAPQFSTNFNAPKSSLATRQGAAKCAQVEFCIDFAPSLALKPLAIKCALNPAGCTFRTTIKVDRILLRMLELQAKSKNVLDAFFLDVIKPTTKVVTCAMLSQNPELLADAAMALKWAKQFRKSAGTS